MNKVPNWKLHEYCPICKTKCVAGCKCMLADRVCENGHNWFMCGSDQKTVIGESDHAKYTNECQCNETAYERTEI